MRYTKYMKSSVLRALVVTGIFVILGAGIAIIVLNKQTQEGDNQALSRRTTLIEQADLRTEYTELPESHRFIKESPTDIIMRLKEGTGIVFIGFKECPWCQRVAPILNEAAEAESVNIYYHDVLKGRKANDGTYQQLVEILRPHLRRDENGAPRIYVPDITFVKDGEIVKRYEQEAAPDSENTPDTYWTEARKEQALDDFRAYIATIK